MRPTTVAARLAARSHTRVPAEAKAKKAARHAKWREGNADYVRLEKRRDKLKHKYGLSLEEYQRMVLEQRNRCAVCLRPETRLDERTPGRTKDLSVDHNHDTGQVRGLLCYKCNVALGLLGDDVLRIEALAEYLRASLDKVAA